MPEEDFWFFKSMPQIFPADAAVTALTHMTAQLFFSATVRYLCAEASS
jgi:hypothetical protein